MSKLKVFAISAVCVILAFTVCLFAVGCEKQPDDEALYNDDAFIANGEGDNVCTKYLLGNERRAELSGRGSYSGVCNIQSGIDELKNYSAIHLKLSFTGRKLKLVFTQGDTVRNITEYEDGAFYVLKYDNGAYDVIESVTGDSNVEFTVPLTDKSWMSASPQVAPPTFKAVCLDAEYITVTYHFIRDGEEPPAPSSDYEKIRAAYREAGYTVDLKTEDLDANTANLVEMMQNMYEQLGYGMCFICKNLSNAAEMELYMLVSADTEEAAIQFVDELSSYQYERNGKNVIVSLNVMTQNPNFGPFNGI